MLFSIFLLLVGVNTVFAKCRCTPTDKCWPSITTWNALNASVHGKLIHNQPLAEPCYPGSDYNPQTCQYISAEWDESSFRSLNPVGYSYPLVNTCPPINTTVAAYPVCDLGTAPVYTIRATEASDVAAGIAFAKNNNIRLVLKNTGHDIVGRSQGYGSLMIWIKYIRTGIHYQESYTPSDGCQSNWTGSAFTVGGGYVWDDLYAVAARHGRIVVGGDDPTVGIIGGYLQGGGHGPASHDFGLGTDQVLEMTVVLASGETVTASACQNADLFTALRGGGGGTYGVAVSTTIKAYPTRPVLAHELTALPVNTSVSTLLSVSAEIISKYPFLSDAGFSGYGTIAPGSLIPQASGVEAIYSHTIGKIIPSANASASIQHAKSALNKQLLKDLLRYNGTFFINSTWSVHPSFEHYRASLGGPSPVGKSNVLMTSRLFDKASLLNNASKLRNMLQIVCSNTEGAIHLSRTVLELFLVGGDKVLHPTPYTSVHPAWRRSYLLAEIVSAPSDNSDSLAVQSAKDDVTFRKTNAMRALTPGSGSYVNEADGDDPSWKEDFYGDNYGWLKSVKEKYDPEETFYCPRCVGSEGWAETTDGRGYGPLCQQQ